MIKPNKSGKERKVKSLSHVRLFATPWTVACQAPLSMGFSRHEYWSALPCPPPGDLPDQVIEHSSVMSLTLETEFFTTNTTWKDPKQLYSN